MYACVSGGKNVSFSKYFAYVLNDWSLGIIMNQGRKSELLRRCIFNNFKVFGFQEENW